MTSPTGAVIRDMLHGFTERCPTHVIVWPVRVQGETCAAEVAAAIRGFNAIDALSPFPKPDLLIVARGGGSLEDLWGFNEEAVVRAAAESAIPLISAVGHETDWTLIDLVADARAPTPTKAAEWAVPKHSDLVLRLSECIGRARHSIRRHLEGLRSEFRGAERGLPRPQNLLAIPRQRLDTAGARLGQSLRHFSDRSRGRFERCAVRLTPRLISAPLELLTGRLARAGEGAGRAFRLTVAKKRDRLDGRSERLQPGLLAGPAARQRERLARAGEAAGRAFQLTVAKKRDRLDDRAERLQPGLLAAPAARQRERLQSLIARAGQGVRNALKRKASEAGSLSQLLRTLSHKSVLDRGFALVRDAEGHVIRRAEAAKSAVLLDIEFADGHVSAKLGEEAQERRAPERKGPATPHRAKQLNKDDGSQGSLL